MPHQGGEPSRTVTDIFERTIGGARTWIGQWSGPLKALRLPQGLLDFKLLSNAPSNPPSGWARLHVLNNALKLVNSSGTDLLASLGQDLTHHSYPWLFEGDALQDTDAFHQWPGFTVSTVNEGGAAGVSAGLFTSGEELDGRATSRRTSYIKVNNLSTEEGGNPTIDLRMAVPAGFTQFGTNGIVLRHKIAVAAGAGAGTDTGVVSISVYDPTTGSDTVAASASRTLTSDVADDTVYQELQITGSTLNGVTNPLVAGEMLHIQIACSGAFVEGISTPSFWLGRLSVYFE